MAQFDVAVIGAGPAGSLTAYRLARGGARVLLVDKAQFPRDKPCGGGLTMRAVKELPFSLEPVVEDVVRQVECRLGY
ncbi:MAG: FAD-dependent oxidoreductase, partial [Acidobacteria bacterium]|nr:FAD-dependent oxidoreductase [Acidobacteriota bacterium]